MNNHICTIHKKTITLHSEKKQLLKHKIVAQYEKNHHIFNRIAYADRLL